MTAAGIGITVIRRASLAPNHQSGSHGTKSMLRGGSGTKLSVQLRHTGSCRPSAMPIIGMADVLRDNRAVVRAASQASKAADFLLSFIPDSVASAPSDSVVDDWEAA